VFNTIISSINLIPKEYKPRFYFLLILSLLSVIFETLSISLFIPFISYLTGSDQIDSAYFLYILNFLQNTNFFGLGSFFENESIKIFSSIVILFLLRSIIQAYFIFKNAQLTYGIEMQLSKDIFRMYLNKDYEFYLKNNPSYLLRNILTETNKFCLGVLGNFTSIFTELFIILALVILGLITNKFFFIGAFCFFLFFGLLFYLSTKNKIINYGKVRFDADGKKMKHVQEGLMSVVEIKLMKIADIFIDFFKKQALNSYNINIRYSFLIHVPKIMFEIIFIFTVFTLFVSLFYFDFTEEKILNLVAIFAIISIRLIPSIAKLISNIQSFNFSKKSIDVLQELVTEKELESFKSIDEKYFNKNNFDFNRLIKLTNISFSYLDENDKKKDIIDNLNLEIKKNDKIGIFGGSGVGKTTFLKILISLIKPNQGQILVDDKILDEENLEFWHNKIGYVSQNTTILDDSLIFNITLSNSEINYDYLKKLLKKLNLSRFITSDGKIENVNIGDKGSKISGGEKQRIGICRALYKNPQILILDEPTSSLDKENEKIIIRDIFELENITTILVSHNLENFKFCTKTFELLNKSLKKLN
jgi:ATP-binding cassette, subfamily B, bacterial PglK